METQLVSVELDYIELEVIEALLAQKIVAKRMARPVVRETASIQELLMGSSRKEYANALRAGANNFSAPAKEALEDFIAKNMTDVKLVFPATGLENADIIKQEIIDEMTTIKPGRKFGYWDIFYEHFPNAAGLVTISQVGMDSKGSIAFIYLGMLGGCLAGEGFTRILRRSDENWVLTNECIGSWWIS